MDRDGPDGSRPAEVAEWALLRLAWMAVHDPSAVKVLVSDLKRYPEVADPIQGLAVTLSDRFLRAWRLANQKEQVESLGRELERLGLDYHSAGLPKDYQGRINRIVLDPEAAMNVAVYLEINLGRAETATSPPQGESGQARQASPAELAAYLDWIDKTWLDALNRQLEQVPTAAELVAAQTRHVSAMYYRNDQDVSAALDILRRAKGLLPGYRQLCDDMSRSIRIERPGGISSHSASSFTAFSPFLVAELVRGTEHLIEVCEAFARLAARERGVIGPGAPLTDAALMELEITVTPPNGTKQGEGEKPNATPAAGHERAEGETQPAEPYADLRRHARDKLKGKERAVAEALCESGGELPIADLAIREGVVWGDPDSGFKGAQRRLNRKLKRIGWRVERLDNSAKLTRLGGERGAK